MAQKSYPVTKSTGEFGSAISREERYVLATTFAGFYDDYAEAIQIGFDLNDTDRDTYLGQRGAFFQQEGEPKKFDLRCAECQLGLSQQALQLLFLAGSGMINGVGGFSADPKEAHTLLNEKKCTCGNTSCYCIYDPDGVPP